jgi:hypothetical protein
VTGEHLTDGWEPDLPVSDTLLRRFLFNLAAFNELPAVAAGARVVRGDEFAAADLGRPAAMHNAATLLLGERVLGDERLRLWVGYEGDRPVCIGTLFVAFGVAAFSLGVTLPEARPGAAATGRPWPGSGSRTSRTSRPSGCSAT